MTDKEQSKHPGGRPSKYDKDYHPQAIMNMMQEGMSVASVSREFKVNKDSIYEWAKKHKEFSVALKNGQDWCQGWWEDQGRQNVRNKEFNSTLWYMNMKNRFNWQDYKPTYKPKKLKKLKGSLEERAKAFLSYLHDGTLTLDEISCGLDGLAKEATVMEKTVIAERVEQLMVATGLQEEKKK